jgi:hypothetical protein
MKTADFGKPVERVAEPGVCRICKCTDDRACTIGNVTGGLTLRACAWADETRTLCDSPRCLIAARAELNVRPADDLLAPYTGTRYGFAS